MESICRRSGEVSARSRRRVSASRGPEHHIMKGERTMTRTTVWRRKLLATGARVLVGAVALPGSERARPCQADALIEPEIRCFFVRPGRWRCRKSPWRSSRGRFCNASRPCPYLRVCYDTHFFRASRAASRNAVCNGSNAECDIFSTAGVAFSGVPDPYGGCGSYSRASVRNRA